MDRKLACLRRAPPFAKGLCCFVVSCDSSRTICQLIRRRSIAIQSGVPPLGNREGSWCRSLDEEASCDHRLHQMLF